MLYIKIRLHKNLKNNSLIIKKIMCKLLDNYVYKLRFKLDSNAPIKFVESFGELRKKIENGDNSHISSLIKYYSKLNKNIEGGLGYKNKQLRYRHNFKTYLDNDIVIDIFDDKQQVQFF